jgi:hypothetical protein
MPSNQDLLRTCVVVLNIILLHFTRIRVYCCPPGYGHDHRLQQQMLPHIADSGPRASDRSSKIGRMRELFRRVKTGEAGSDRPLLSRCKKMEPLKNCRNIAPMKREQDQQGSQALQAWSKSCSVLRWKSLVGRHKAQRSLPAIMR